MKKDLKDIILNSVPNKYHRKLEYKIDKYETIEDNHYFRINLLILLAIIVLILLVILRYCIGC